MWARTLAGVVVILVLATAAGSAAAAPVAVTTAASAVTAESATLTGTVNPGGTPITDCHFEINPPPKLGSSIPCAEQVGSGTAPVAVSAPLIDLGGAVTYSYRLVVNGIGGALVSFRTPALAPDPPEIAKHDVTWVAGLRVDRTGRLHLALHNHLAIALDVVSIVARGAAPAAKTKHVRAVAATVKKPAKPRPLVAQTLVPALRAQHTTALVSRLTRAAWAKLRTTGRARVTVTVTVVAPDGFLARFSRTTTLRAPHNPS